jgi:magnesium chelatase family protein
MLAKSKTCAVVGLDGYVVEVEVDISPSLPTFIIVGLPDAAVQEARERVRAAIRNSGREFPMRRITVSLAPPDLRKAGPSYDLPIALAVLLSSGQVAAAPESAMFLGELSLDGGLRHTNGILPMVVVAREEGIKSVFLPEQDAAEAALVEGVDIIPLKSLTQMVDHLSGDSPIAPFDREANLPAPGEVAPPKAGRGVARGSVDMSEIRGQEHAKRALEVAAAGGHNILFSGPPGSGKTLLARTLPSILPALTHDEALDVTKIYSVGGLLPSSSPLIRQRPFRAPHYTISNAGLVGGGRIPQARRDHAEPQGRTVPRGATGVRPHSAGGSAPASGGQGSHNQPCSGLDNLSCQLHDGVRNEPVSLRLLRGPGHKECSCTPSTVSRYKRRISGPLLDRIDLFVEVPRVEYEKLVEANQAETSDDVRTRTEKARAVQQERFADSGLITNSEMGPVEVWD